MAGQTGVRIRALTAADISAAQRLREQAGWNQTVDDWHRLLAWDAAGCWVAEIAQLDGADRPDGLARQIVGTTTVARYGQRIAWIGMVLVDEAHRRQGIGQALLTHALAYLEACGVQTVALDSTPAGQPLYAGLGFVDAFELARWRGPFPTLAAEALVPDGLRATDLSTPDPGTIIRPVLPADLPALAAYDAPLFGVERAHILGALLAGYPAACRIAERDGQMVGYALGRPGARAWHLGPVAADTAQIAEALVWSSLAGAGSASASDPEGPRELLMDAVMPNGAAVALAQWLGLTLVRPFIRMTRGAPPPNVDFSRLYTSAGPELG